MLDLAKVKTRLIELKAQVTDTIAQVEDEAKPVELDQNRVGRLSRMDAMQGQAMAQANADRQRTLLNQIDKALKRVELGHYGRCQECDEWIPLARLELDPVSTHCVRCAEAIEQR